MINFFFFPPVCITCFVGRVQRKDALLRFTPDDPQLQSSSLLGLDSRHSSSSVDQSSHPSKLGFAAVMTELPLRDITTMRQNKRSKKGLDLSPFNPAYKLSVALKGRLV